jgi:DNA-binding CsgD family transcriptional regulator
MPVRSALTSGKYDPVRSAGPPGSSLISPAAWTRVGDVLRLSPREMQIVQRIFEDEKEETIAFHLSISPHTVNTYVQRLYRKLSVFSRPQLILTVIAEYLALPLDEPESVTDFPSRNTSVAWKPDR